MLTMPERADFVKICRWGAGGVLEDFGKVLKIVKAFVTHRQKIIFAALPSNVDVERYDPDPRTPPMPGLKRYLAGILGNVTEAQVECRRLSTKG